MSNEQLAIDDLDIDTLGMVLTKVAEYDARIANIQKERNKIAGIASGHLERIATAKGLILADHNVDLAKKTFVPKQAESEAEVKV